MKLDYLNIVFKDIKNRKFSSILTFFAISLGILSIFVIILISQGFQQSLKNEFEKLGSNRVIIQSEGSGLNSFNKQLTDKEVDLIKNRPYVKDASPYYVKNVQLEYSREYITRMVFGSYLDKDFFEDYDLELKEGRFPRKTEKYSIVLGSKAAEDLFKKKVNVGSNIYVKGYKFKVVGILKSIGNPEDDKNIYFPIDTLRKIYNNKDTVHMIYVSIIDNYDVNLAAKNLETLLENRLGKDTITVNTLQDYLNSFQSILNIVQLTLGGIALISLIVGAFGIINTMFVIITEKTKEIGIMKAIGAKNSDIFFIYVFQAGLFGLLGGILGILFGSLGGIGFEKWANSTGYNFLKITIEPMLVLTLLLFSFFIGAISGFLPAYRASKLKIVDTLRK